MPFTSLGSPAFTTSLRLYAELAAPYAALGALALAIIALLLLLTMRRRLARLALGKNGSLEESLAVLTREMKGAQEFRAEVGQYLALVETRLKRSLSGLGVVRFNPFEGVGQGGNQSFAAAFLDEEGNGVVLSTLHARERALVYAKPVENGVSSYALTAEEQEALEKARRSIASRKKK